ncbi:dipeptide ABC transporter ATP-binding protein [Metasolibacillus sp. FSL K6-0083]|uniref:ABC transporter ATP-binding protein n=1 Tax=Metasolibacillus sp. FSL K6-0083 TaxID=2921416 RepID=UPI00315AE648
MEIKDEVILNVKELKKYYPMKKNKAGATVVKAVDNVDFHIKKGEILGIVGESGCGKSTLAKVIIQLLEATTGDILLEGKSLMNCKGPKLKEVRRSMQMIFQDPYASLNPRWTIERTLLEPLIVHKIGTKQERQKIIKNIMKDVGLDESYLSRYPHEFSGGQRQRIGIARALVLNPKLIIADEPVSALDISVQAQILNLLKDLQEEYDLTYMFITHDLSVVQYIADRIMVMYLGRIVEIGDTETIFSKPLHPYTEALISAVPQVTEEKSKERIIIKGDLPSPTSPPTGCHFHTRCPFAMEKCKTEQPQLQFTNDSRAVACHLHS